MMDFLKYLLAGLAGLAFNVAFPQLPVDCFAIVMSLAFLGSARKISAWLLLPLLVCSYSAFSLAPPWMLALPCAFGVLIFFALRKNISLTPAASRLFLLAILWATPMLFWMAHSLLRGGGWYLGWTEAWGFLLTLVCGLWILPASVHSLRSLARRISPFGGGSDRIDLSRADWICARGARILRKPFGLEKGL